jgi:hypothetical protein
VFPFISRGLDIPVCFDVEERQGAGINSRVHPLGADSFLDERRPLCARAESAMHTVSRFCIQATTELKRDRSKCF